MCPNYRFSTREKGEDAGVLLNRAIYTVSIPPFTFTKFTQRKIEVTCNFKQMHISDICLLYLLAIFVRDHHMCPSSHWQSSWTVSRIPLTLHAISRHLNAMDVGTIVAQIEALLAGASRHIMWQVERENLNRFHGFQWSGTVLLDVWSPASNNEDNVVNNSKANDSIDVVTRIQGVQ